MRIFKHLFIGILILLSLSCGSTKAINPLNLLTGNSWALSSLMGNGLHMNQFPGGIPSLSFLEGRNLAGFSGCNNFSGSFILKGFGLQLDTGGITKKCVSVVVNKTFFPP